jgi:hypothetical protein
LTAATRIFKILKNRRLLFFQPLTVARELLEGEVPRLDHNAPSPPTVDTETAKDTTVIGTHDIHREIQLLVHGQAGPVIRELFEHFRNRYHRIQQFLREANINRHGPAHQARVVGIALAIARAFQRPDDAELSDAKLLAAAIPAFGHDLGYEPTAHPMPDRVEKETVDYHPVRAARMWAEILGDHRFDTTLEQLESHYHIDPTLDDVPSEKLLKNVREFTSDWSDELREISIRSPWHHSNGSDYDRTKPLVDKLIRLADKIEMRNRVDIERLKPGIQEEFPKTYVHQTVPACITNMNIEIDRQRFTIVYDVDTRGVAVRLGKYSEDDFLHEFDRAYKKAMHRGAEVVQSLFEHRSGIPLDDEHPCLTITFRFPNGREEVKRYAPDRPGIPPKEKPLKTAALASADLVGKIVAGSL